MDQVDLMDLMDKMGAPVFALTGYAVASQGITRGFAVPRWGGTQEADVPQGYAGNVMATVVRGRKMYRGVMQAVFNGNGGLRGAGAWRLHGKFWEFLRGVWGRHCIPRGFACRWEVGRVGQMCRRGEQTQKNSTARLEESAAAPTGKSVRDF